MRLVEREIMCLDSEEDKAAEVCGASVAMEFTEVRGLMRRTDGSIKEKTVTKKTKEVPSSLGMGGLNVVLALGTCFIR